MELKNINRKTVSNYIIVGLIVFAVTSFSLTYYVFPTYAAPNVSTFFSCETSDGCAYRYNTTQYLAPLPNNMTQIGNWSTSSLVYQMLGNETFVINGSAIQRTTPFALLHLSYTPAINGTMGLHIVTDLNGQPNSESLEIEVNASSISAGFPTVFSAFVDKGASTGGDIHSFNTLAVGTGTIQVVGLGVFSGIDPIHQHSGSTTNMDKALIYDGSFSDVTAAFVATGNDTSIFVSVDDSVYIGDNSQFGEIQFNLDTIASGAGIRPTFEFSTGAGGWTVFSPIDGTDGMRADGGVAYEKNDLTGWAVDTISGFGPHFWIRINRTQIGLGTVPIEDLVQIVVDTDFIWDEDGNVEIFGMNVTDVLGISSGNGVIILAGGRPILFTPTYPSTMNWNGTWDHDFNSAGMDNLAATCNDMGNPNAFCASTFSGNVLVGANDYRTTSFRIFEGSNDNLFIYNLDANQETEIRIIPNGNSFSTLYIHATDFVADNANWETLQLGEQGANFVIKTNKDGTGVFRPLLIQASGGDVVKIYATDNVTLTTLDWVPSANNTLSIGRDALRFADFYSVVSHQKTLDTGLILENEYAPNPFEIFDNGDVVCLKEWLIFTKCDATYNKVLGPVYLLRERGILGYNNVSYLEDGKTKHRLEAVWDNLSYEPRIVVEGPYRVKVCEPVFERQLLIAGNNGCVIGVSSYSAIPSLMFPIGYAALDSKGGYVDAVIL